MYFKINKKEFLDHINIVSNAISFTSPLPVLHNVKVLVKDNFLQLTSSNSDISIQTSIFTTDDAKLEIFAEGSILLDGKYFSDMIRKIDSDIVEVETIDGTYTNIRGLLVNFELNGIKADNYPLIDFSEPNEQFFLKAETLKNLIYQTAFAASEKEIRPVLTGINFSCNGNVLTCVATDSYRLAQKKLELDEQHAFNITIPATSLRNVAKIISSDNDIKVAFSDKTALFVIDNVLVKTRLIDGMYPETSRLIPTSYENELVIDARDLLNAIDRASFIKKDGVFTVKMELNDNEVTISSRSEEVVSIEKVVPISYQGEPLVISFRGNYVYDAIRVLNALQIYISFSGSMKPFVLKGKDDNDVLQLVSPLKSYS